MRSVITVSTSRTVIITTSSLRVMMIVIVIVIGGGRRYVDPFLLPLSDRAGEHGGRSVTSRGPAESGPNSLHCGRSVGTLVDVCILCRSDCEIISYDKKQTAEFLSLFVLLSLLKRLLRLLYFLTLVGIRYTRFQITRFCVSSGPFKFEYSLVLLTLVIMFQKKMSNYY